MKELEQYIFYYFSSLLTVHEKAAWKSINTEFKIRDDEGTQYATVLRQRWVSTNPNVVALLSEGSEKFFENANESWIVIYQEYGDGGSARLGPRNRISLDLIGSRSPWLKLSIGAFRLRRNDA